MIPATIFALLLVGVSTVLVLSHRSARQRVAALEQIDEISRQFAESQYYRRTMASGTIGLLGVAIALAPLVPRRPWPLTAYVAALLCACIWIIILALLDMRSSRSHLRRLENQVISAEAKLAEELGTAQKQQYDRDG